MHRYLSAFLLSVALVTPIVARADDHQQTKRYYDKAHKDYHEWNDNEQRSYDQYQQEQHMQSRDFAKRSSSEQSQYFKWRHDHPDGAQR
jgi:hypothetical protein